MTDSSGSPRSDRVSTLQVTTLLLSVYVLLALVVQSVLPIDHEMHVLLERIDFYVCLVFLLDFAVGFYKAPSKRAYMKWGWIDLIASIPMLDAFRAGRVIRIIRLFRLLRAFRASKYLVTYFFKRRRGTSMLAVVTISLILVVFSAIAILQFETAPESNIKTAEDAFWWAYTTVTTVGYGDKFPLSVEGRIIAAILMTVGVGLFGTFTGFVASHFVEPEIEREESEIKLLTREIAALREQVAALDRRLDERKDG